jgi:pimeloyl-ACP methyl ester carboxylesterase
VSSVRVNDLTLAYREAGHASRPALVLLHGWPHSSAIYADVLDELGRDSYVLAFDLPDIGASRGAPPSAEKHVLADIVLAAAETLGARSILIAGFDVGGMIAFAAAREHGSRIVAAAVANTVIPGLEPWSKVSADPRIFHFALHAIPRLPETLVTGRERPYFDFFFDVLAKNPRSLSDELRNTLVKAYQRPEALTAGFDWYRAFARDAARNLQSRKIDVPMLYLRGDADGRHVEDYAAGLRAGGVTHLDSGTIANSGEYLPVEAPEEFCSRLREFRAAVSAAAK